MKDICFDEKGNRERIARLRDAGVLVWGPERVFIGSNVELGRIESGAVLMNAVIAGEQTAIGSQSRIGVSGTAFLVNTQVGRGVELGAGSYEEATLFDGVRVRGFAEFRRGTVLEELAEAGHNVGLKHTFLTTGVVAGSCINLCDVLVTGGSSRQDHTEIGSGAVHFNFDPRGDKFGSLVGDVTGLLLRQRRIFVGGNCGIVAPVRIAFGAVIAAGTTVRRDIEAGRLYLGEGAISQATQDRHFDPEVYHDLGRKLLSTTMLAGNLQALEAWYARVRLPRAKGLERSLCEGALRNIRIHLEHRAMEFDKVLSKIGVAKRTGNKTFEKQHFALVQHREQILEVLTRAAPTLAALTNFMERYEKARLGTDHCSAIREMPERVATEAELWLAELASRPSAEVSPLLQ